MAAIVIELELIPFDGKAYLTAQDAARYLCMSVSSVEFFARRGRMTTERWLLEWESVQAFGRELRGKRQLDYEVRIIRPARANG